MTENRRNAGKGYNSEEESFNAPSGEQVFINFADNLHITGSQVIIQIGDQNQVNVGTSIPNLTTVTAVSSGAASDQSFSSDGIGSSSEEPLYMDMSSVRERLGSLFSDSDTSDGRRYSNASRSSDTSNTQSISRPRTSSSTSASFSDPPDLQTDGLNSVRKSDIVPNDQNARRLSLPIPERLMHEGAQNAHGFRVDVDAPNQGIPAALKQVYMILRPYIKRGQDGYFILWTYDKCIVSLSVTYLQRMINYAIQYDGRHFYILEDGPMRLTISELIKVYLKEGIRMSTKSMKSGNDNASTWDSSSSLYDNNTNIPLRSHSGSHLSNGPKLPEKPKSFLSLKRPVDREEEIRTNDETNK